MVQESFEGLTLKGDRLEYKRFSWNVWECDAAVEQGAQVAARMTATRVVTGALLLGPVGAVLGGLAKKNRSKVYLCVNVPADVVLIELDAKREGRARAFANKVNATAVEYATKEAARLRRLDEEA